MYVPLGVAGLIAAVGAITKTWKSASVYWLEMMAFGATFVTVIVELILQLVVIEKGVFSFHPDVILVLIIDLFAIGVVLFGIATPFVNITVKKANVGDYVLVATAIFFALSCATLAIAFSTIRLIVFGAGLLLTCITIVARAFVLYHH